MFVFGVVTPILIFLVLGFEVRGRRTLAWDSAVLDFLKDQPVRFPDDLLRAERPAAALFGCLLVLLAAKRRAREAVLCAVALGGALVLDLLLKPAFPRPSLSGEGDLSFPSGYALISITAASVVVLLAWATRWRRAALLLGVAAVLVSGLALVDSSWHYPSDVVGGWCVGISWVSALWLLMSRHAMRFARSLLAPAAAPRG